MKLIDEYKIKGVDWIIEKNKKNSSLDFHYKNFISIKIYWKKIYINHIMQDKKRESISKKVGILSIQ